MDKLLKNILEELNDIGIKYDIVEKNEPHFNNIKEQVRAQGSQNCRWSITEKYINESIEKAAIIYVFMLSLKDKFYPGAFITLNYLKDNKHPYISLLCSREFKMWDEDDNDYVVPINLGTLLLNLCVQDLKNKGYKNIYLDASETKTINFYHSLGFAISKQFCDAKSDSYPHKVYKVEEMDEEIKNKYKTKVGYRMRLCDLDNEDLVKNTTRRVRTLIDYIRSNKKNFKYDELFSNA